MADLPPFPPALDADAAMLARASGALDKIDGDLEKTRADARGDSGRARDLRHEHAGRLSRVRDELLERLADLAGGAE